MFHISPQRERERAGERGRAGRGGGGEKKKRTEAANMFKTLLYTHTHTHTRDPANCSRDTTLVLIRPALVCVDVCVIPPRAPLHLWVGHEILNTLVHVVYFHH